MFVPFRAFGKFDRADLGGGTYQTISQISPAYTTGVIAHNKVFKAGATVLDGCEGQVILTGTSAIPLPTFAGASGTSQTLANCTITAGASSITVSSSATLAVGMAVSGTGLLPNCVITQVVDGTHVTVTVPAITSSSTASLTFYAVSDGTNPIMPESEPVFTAGSVGANSLVFSPLRLGCKIKCSKQLLAQSPAVFIPILKEQISRGISSQLDNLALFGTGPANGQPLGIFSTVTPVNLAASPMTWANYQNYRTTILRTDLDPDSYGGILSPAFLNYADQTQAYTGASYSIWEKMVDGHPDRFFIGNEINTSTAMASGKGIFLGLWRFVYIMIWTSGMELQWDPYSSADTNETVIRATILANVGTTFPAAFQAIYQN